MNTSSNPLMRIQRASGTTHVTTKGARCTENYRLPSELNISNYFLITVIIPVTPEFDNRTRFLTVVALKHLRYKRAPTEPRALFSLPLLTSDFDFPPLLNLFGGTCFSLSKRGAGAARPCFRFSHRLFNPTAVGGSADLCSTWRGHSCLQRRDSSRRRTSPVFSHRLYNPTAVGCRSDL